MGEKARSLYGEKTSRPIKPSSLVSCPVNCYKCEKCPNDDFAGCCPIGSSCMCRDGCLDACETI